MTVNGRHMFSVPARITNHDISRARLRRLISAGNRLAMVIAVWALFWPRPYFPLVGLCVAVPLLAIAAEVRFRGRVDWEQSSRRATPFSLAAIATFPALALFVRAGTDLNIVDWRMLIAWSMLGAIAILGGICSMDPRVRGQKQLIPVILFGCVFSYGTLAMANVTLDPSPATVIPTVIQDMRVRVSGGVKSSSIWHEVRVDPLASLQGRQWIHVRPDVYAQFRRGDHACVDIGRGVLGVRWFDVRPCPAKDS